MACEVEPSIPSPHVLADLAGLKIGFANAIAERRALMELCIERANALNLMAKPRGPSECLCPEEVWKIYDQIIAASKDSYEKYDGSWIDRYLKANKVNQDPDQDQDQDSDESTSPSETVSPSPLPKIEGVNFKTLDTTLRTSLDLCERGTIILAWEEVLAEVREDLKKAQRDLDHLSSSEKRAMMNWCTDPNNNKDARDKFLREVWAEIDGSKKFYFYWLEDLQKEIDKALMKVLGCTTDELTKKTEDIANFCKSMENVLFCDRLVTEKEEQAKNPRQSDRSYSWEPRFVVDSWESSLEKAWKRVMDLPQGAELNRIQRLMNQVSEALAKEWSAAFQVERAKKETLKSITRSLKNAKHELGRLTAIAANIFKRLEQDERKKQKEFYEERFKFYTPISDDAMFSLLHETWNAL